MTAKISGTGRNPGKPRFGYRGKPVTAPFNLPVEFRTCHDVRRIAVCVRCTGVGDKRNMIREGKEYSHGRCFIAMRGLEAFLALPKETTDKLFLCDIGNEAMKALLEATNG